MFKKLLPGVVCALGLAFCQDAGAVMAWPGTFTVTQPDGSDIEIQKYGDERGSIWITTDGYALRQTDKGFFYVLPSGELSSMTARSPELRSPAEKALLGSFAKEMVCASEMKSRAASSKYAGGFRRAFDFKPEYPSYPLPGLFQNTFPTKGKPKSLVFLVEYPDVQFTMDDPRDYFDRMLNEPGYNDRGCSMSARDYFIESSFGEFQPDFVVCGPVRLKNPRSYYGENDPHTGSDRAPEEMVIEACEAYDNEIDFSEFDTNGDGRIDNIFVFYSGVGENGSTISSTVWPHSWDVSYTKKKFFDGVLLCTYGCSSELVPHQSEGSGRLYVDAIGTFCHEFGHVMGLPDLYSTAYKEGAFHPGKWSIMASGSYNDNGFTPPTYSSFERAAMGWISPEPIATGDYDLEHILTSNRAILVPTEKKTEYFLIENRLNVGNDEFLPAEGMLVWHIDFNQNVWENNTCNNDPDHQYIDIVEAGGSRLTSSLFATFPALYETQDFTSDTDPSLRSWAGNRLGVSIKDIRLNDEGHTTFSAVVDYDPATVNGIAGDAVSLRVADGRIFYDGLAGSKAEVFAINGVSVTEIKGGAASGSLDKGVYIVRTPEGTAKVVVK